jgi:zinc protease
MKCYAMLIALALSSAVWAADASDDKLPRDPNNVYGQFDNGLKYIVRKNANPPGKVALYLHVKTGALNETDQQNGLAHFLEHMAFNGSTHYEPGKLIPLLNHLGMTFGADTNAHTNLWETVYKLTMPDTKDKTIDTALTIFSDYASGLGLAKVQIDSERRIILEESRSRKSVEQRLRKKLIKELFADTRLATHDVTGDDEQIKTFPQDQFQDYWNTWYRPENMTLVVVGDIDPQSIIDKAREKLGSFAARAPSREPMKAGLQPLVAPRTLLNTDPEAVSGSVTLLALQPARLPITTRSQLKRDVLEAVSEWIVNRRFSDIVRKGNAPFRHASVDSDDFLHEAYEVTASASGQPEDWNKMLDGVIAEVSRAIDHGFTSHELDLARSEMISGAEQAVRTESTRDSVSIVKGLAGEVGLDLPMLSAQQRLDLMKEILDQITADDLHKTFVDNFKTRNYAYILTMPSSKEGLKLPGNDDILAAANAAWAKKTEAPTEVKLAGSILPSEPDAGKVVSQDTDKDLGITNVTFANGVVMHHKFSDYKKDQAAISILMPGGSIEETAANRGVGAVASIILARPATSRFTSSQIRDLLTGKNVSVGGGIGFDTLDLGVAGSPRDLKIGMQLAYAILTDGVLEQSALDDWKKMEIQGLEARKTSAQAQLTDAMSATFFGGDVRMTPLTREIIDRQERAPAEAWFKRIVGHAAVEVTVVGDLPLNDALELVGKYVGSLPKRTDDFATLNSLRKFDRAPGPFSKTVHFKALTPKAIVYSGFISCDALDPERRPLSLATQIITVRMIERIRKQEQLVYSIGCSNTPGRSLPGTGTISASAPTDPQNADKLAQTILEMLREFADKGPSEDELATAKKQIANRLESQMKEPSFWMAQIEDMAYRGRPIDDLKQLPGIYQTFTVDQVRDAMRKYVKDDRMMCYEVIPDVAPATEPAKTAASRAQ